MAFVQATKEQSKLRLALFGPSGAGKTYTALRIATGMGGPIALADTERRTARKYSDRFKFAVEELSDKSIDAYCKVIKEAGEGNFNVLIIDSLSHAWQELLQDVDKLASAKYRGNTWSAWSEGTPKQRRLVDTLLDCPCHIIATMRSKTDWAQETGNNGKIKPVKIGLAPEQGKGIEYEFDMLMEMSVDHFATISKDRTGKYQDKIIEKPDEQFGRDLIGWLSEGAAPAAPDRASADDVAEMLDLLKVATLPKGWATGCLEKAGVSRWEDMPPETLNKCREYAGNRIPNKQPEAGDRRVEEVTHV
jgi:hypothetical protein